MTEDKVKEIHKERNKLFPIPCIIDFDKRWREVQQLFRGSNEDLSKIQITVERKNKCKEGKRKQCASLRVELF